MSDLISNPALIPPGAAAGPVAPGPGTPGRDAQQTVAGPSFADVLAQQTGVNAAPAFSKHALERLNRRGVQIDNATINRLTDGIQRAAQKGSRNSVVFVEGTAYVTSVQNNTVITAVTPEAMRSHVFTNIDSAVIA
ncbi:MAG: TIGR02530 family flagellar biosynthesis protein [Solirubrobacteraceae bacterium]